MASLHLQAHRVSSFMPQSIMVRWQPPPPGTLNGELTGYKLRYRKGLRRADAIEISTTQLFQLID
ncbi:hypothetical protein M9458_049682, partial [Cirrhinus mrigala]